ncbi:MAG: DUF5615 family PIN-like protein [Bacteroidota bacterium]
MDAHLSPALARWITATFPEVDAYSLQYLGLRHAKDPEIFEKAREANAVVLTKDDGFPEAVGRLGAPPSVIWVRVGNTSTASMKAVLAAQLPAMFGQVRSGAPLVELHDTDAPRGG